METALVVAMTRNRVIGREGAMPWRLSGEMRYFKSLTMGKPLVMGRKTFESIGRPLPGRDTIVVTRQDGLAIEGVTVAADLPSALLIARDKAEARGAAEIMVAGGGQIYAQALPLADRLYVTEIDATLEGDTLFPEIDPADWREVSRESQIEDQPGGPALRYDKVVLERRG